LGRTQLGNNNPYNQDNAISYVRWELGAREQASLAYTQQCFALRRALGLFRRGEHLRGELVGDSALLDVTWLGSDGRALSASDWASAEAQVLAMWTAGHDADGKPDA